MVRGVVRVLAFLLLIASLAVAQAAAAQPTKGQANLASPVLGKLSEADSQFQVLAQEAAEFVVPDHYCPDPMQPSRREDEQRLADLERRMNLAATAYRDLKPKIVREAHAPLMGKYYQEANVDPTTPNFFRGVDADRDAMFAALAKLKAAIGKVPLKPCKEETQPTPQDVGQHQFDGNGVEVGTPAKAYNPAADEKKVGGTPIPPPSYEPFKPLVLPDHFCSITEQHDFKMKVYFPWSDAMGQQTGKAFQYAQELKDRYWNLRHLDAAPDIIEAAERAYEYAEQRAKDMAAARTKLADDTYARIEAIKIVDCDASGKPTGKPVTPPPPPVEIPKQPVLENYRLIDPPQRFCSLEEKIQWLRDHYYPALDAARKEAKVTGAYLDELAARKAAALQAGNTAAAEALDKAYKAYQPLHDQARILAKEIEEIHKWAIDQVPIVDCGTKTTGTPPPGASGTGQLPPGLQRPQMERWETPPLPASFCSEVERVDFLNKVYNPAVAVALANAERANRYLEQLNAAFTEEMRKPGGAAAWAAVQKELAEWKPIAADARARAEAMRALYQQILAIPVKPCPQATTPPSPVTPPPTETGHATTPTLPQRPIFERIPQPVLPDCFPTVADFQAFLAELQEIRRAAEHNKDVAIAYDDGLHAYIENRRAAGDREGAAAGLRADFEFYRDYELWVYDVWYDIDDFAYDARKTPIGCPRVKPMIGEFVDFTPVRPYIPGFSLRTQDRFCTEAEKRAYIEALRDAIDILYDNKEALEGYLDRLDNWADMLPRDNIAARERLERERRWARQELESARQADAQVERLLDAAERAPVGCPDDRPRIGTGPLKPCPDDVKPIDVGPNSKVGSSARTREKAVSTAMGIVGGLLGGGGGGGGGGGSSGPPLITCRIKDGEMTVFDDPATGVSLRVGAKETKDGATVYAKIDKSPDSGTFQTAYAENANGDQQAPASVGMCGLWGEWQLTVSWTKTTYVDGQVVSRESGGWSKSGTFGIPGVVSTANRPDGLWRRLGFSNASHGAREVALGYRLSPQDLANGVDMVIQVTRPKQDPVTTVPFVVRMKKVGSGFTFERVRGPCDQGATGPATSPIRLAKAGAACPA